MRSTIGGDRTFHSRVNNRREHGRSPSGANAAMRPPRCAAGTRVAAFLAGLVIDLSLVHLGLLSLRKCRLQRSPSTRCTSLHGEKRWAGSRWRSLCLTGSIRSARNPLVKCPPNDRYPNRHNKQTRLPAANRKISGQDRDGSYHCQYQPAFARVLQ